MAETKGLRRRVETAEAASAPLSFWAVLSKMALPAAPEAVALAYATLTLFWCQFCYLDGRQVRGRHAGVGQGGSVARTAARRPDRLSLGHFNAERVCHERLKVVISSDAQRFPDRSLQPMAVAVDFFRLRDVSDIQNDAEERFVEASDVVELTPALQRILRRLQLVQGLEAEDEAGAERVPVGDAGRSIVRLPPVERFTTAVGTRITARFIGLAARNIGVHVRAPRLDGAQFSGKQRRLIRLRRAVLSRQQIFCPR